MSKFSKKDYNFVAKRIREQSTWEPDSNSEAALCQRAALTILALDFAKAYMKDNLSFDPLVFLDACTPDVDRLPLSELWEDYLVELNNNG